MNEGKYISNIAGGNLPIYIDDTNEHTEYTFVAFAASKDSVFTTLEDVDGNNILTTIFADSTDKTVYITDGIIGMLNKRFKKFQLTSGRIIIYR